MTTITRNTQTINEMRANRGGLFRALKAMKAQRAQDPERAERAERRARRGSVVYSTTGDVGPTVPYRAPR